MAIDVLLSAVGLAVTIVTGFAIVMRAIGRIELKLQLVWEWYLSAHRPEVRLGGRRHYDPPTDFAHDAAGPAPASGD